MPHYSVVTVPLFPTSVVDPVGANTTPTAPPHEMVLSPAGRAVLAADTNFTPEMMLEEGHGICLDDLQMGQFLETLRCSVTGPSAEFLSPIPLFLVRALMRLYVPHGLDYLLLYQLEQMACELVQFARSPEHIALSEVMPLDHSAADYECVDTFWTYGLNRDDTVILKTLKACCPVQEPDAPVSTHSALWPPALDFQVHLTRPPMCCVTLT